MIQLLAYLIFDGVGEQQKYNNKSPYNIFLLFLFFFLRQNITLFSDFFNLKNFFNSFPDFLLLT